MIYLARWKIILTVLVCLGGFAYTAPNFMSAQMRDNLPDWVPHRTVNLGLDLRGGAHLLYQVAVDGVFVERLQTIRQDMRSTLRKEKISYRKLDLHESDEQILLVIRDQNRAEDARKLIRKNYEDLDIDVRDDGAMALSYGSEARVRIQSQTLDQSIEIVRRRIDSLGTTEPLIQRQGDDRILVQAPGGDASALKKVIGTTAKLTFHLLAEPGQAGGLILPEADNPERRLTLQREALITGDMLDDAYPTDQQGQVAIGFKLGGVGAHLFCDVTRDNVGKPFAIVLDEEILSAPTIQGAICGGSGVITGNFNYASAAELATLLRAGALPAPMYVLEERSVGPSLGADSVAAGKMASLYGMIGVLVFMIVTYSLFGAFASVALVVNLGLIMGVLSMVQATLTLPGIAGIVLTVGMAVDANVLIFERIREELALGRKAINAIDAGYRHAMSTIVDSNLTSLIAAFILFSFGTGPIKGFAVTLGIGIMTSFFAAIMVTRLLVVLWLKGRRPQNLPI